MTPEEIKKYHLLSRNELFLEACKEGNLENVASLITNNGHNMIHATKVETNDRVYNGLAYACEKGHFDIVKYLLTDPKILNKSDIEFRTGMPLQKSCENGYLNIVEFLLTSNLLEKKANIHAQGDMAFILACKNNHHSIVEYLTTSKDIKEHSHINTQENLGLKFAIRENNLEVIKFLTQSTKLEECLNINAPYVLTATLKYKRFEILDYLISSTDFTLTHEMANEIKSRLGKKKAQPWLEKFERRRFFDKISEDLNEKNQETKKMKI